MERSHGIMRRRGEDKDKAIKGVEREAEQS